MKRTNPLIALGLSSVVLAAIACGTSGGGTNTEIPEAIVALSVQQTQTAAAAATNAANAPGATSPPASQPSHTPPPAAPSATSAEASPTTDGTPTATSSVSPTPTSGPTSTPGAGPVAGPTSNQPGQPGTITGALSYPSEAIPRLKVYAWDRESGQWRYAITAQNQQTYELQVPPGKYIVFAWLADGGSVAGGYTNAVLCGLTAACTDHTLYVVTVGSGQHVAGVDVMDWYGPEGFIPKPPG